MEGNSDADVTPVGCCTQACKVSPTCPKLTPLGWSRLSRVPASLGSRTKQRTFLTVPVVAHNVSLRLADVEPTSAVALPQSLGQSRRLAETPCVHTARYVQPDVPWLRNRRGRFHYLRRSRQHVPTDRGEASLRRRVSIVVAWLLYDL